MKKLQEAVCRCLQEATGVKAVCDRTAVRGLYPLLAVKVAAGGTLLLDGGRQAETTYQVSVTALSDRDREDNTALLATLPPVLLRGIPMEERVLHPLDIRSEGEELTFSLELCVPVPPLTGEDPEATETMARLHLGI